MNVQGRVRKNLFFINLLPFPFGGTSDNIFHKNLKDLIINRKASGCRSCIAAIFNFSYVILVLSGGTISRGRRNYARFIRVSITGRGPGTAFLLKVMEIGINPESCPAQGIGFGWGKSFAHPQ
jgi:hypothetical protein